MNKNKEMQRVRDSKYVPHTNQTLFHHKTHKEISCNTDRSDDERANDRHQCLSES